MKIRLGQRQKLKPLLIKLIFGSALLIIAFSIFFLYENLGNPVNVQAGIGMHGAKTITTANVIVNEFTTLTSDAGPGALSITVGSSSLNTNGRFSGNLASGELVMIIQMQGATMNTASVTSSSWGAVTAYNYAGKFEFAQVASVPNSTTINLSSSLLNSYTASGKVQVIRVPRYTTLTINSGASLTTQAWNGSTGGVIAIEDSSSTMVNGTINVNGLGFRGGALLNTASVDQTYRGSNWNAYASTNNASGGAYKGEGIGGDTTVYKSLGGQYGRGAPANGGGGGNNHNGGGGGGSNGNNGVAYNGFGYPDTVTNATWKTCWDLDSAIYPSMTFHKNTSSGGGRGGYSYAKNNKDETTVAPRNSLWAGDWRSNVGGLGGRPLDNTGNRIFMGGGGGAPDANDGFGSKGANGGGIVYILSGGAVSGTGVIYADGDSATTSGGKDAAGGGGGGGSVIIYSLSSSLTGLTINARGGKGGNQSIGSNESEGPGGGGGGGYVSLSVPNSFTVNYYGGINGTTNSGGVSVFTPNGATNGALGTTSIPTEPYSGIGGLPIYLTSFSAIEKENIVEVSWTTSSEINNDYFTIKRSHNGIDYSILGKIKGAGNSTSNHYYRFDDDAPMDGNNYYQLMQTDYDGKSKSFSPVYLKRNQRLNGNSLVFVYPNPFENTVRIDYHAKASGAVEFHLLNQFGQIVKSESVTAGEGMNSFELNNLSNLSPGIYFISVSGAEKNSSLRILKL